MEKLRHEVIAMREKILASHRIPAGLFDVKHSPGGLVDVEFIVQYLVLAYAIRHAELTGNIGNIALLKLSGDLGLLPAPLSAQAADCYRELRRLQHLAWLNDEPAARLELTESKASADPVKQLWSWLFNRPAE